MFLRIISSLILTAFRLWRGLMDERCYSSHWKLYLYYYFLNLFFGFFFTSIKSYLCHSFNCVLWFAAYHFDDVFPCVEFSLNVQISVSSSFARMDWYLFSLTFFILVAQIKIFYGIFHYFFLDSFFNITITRFFW